MAEKQRVGKERFADDELSDLQWDYLNDEVAPDDPRRSDPALRWRFYELDTNRRLGSIDARPCAELWARYGPQILERWVAERPGTRPSCWWRFEGPDGADGMLSCAPSERVQPGKLKGLGALTKREEGRVVRGVR